MPSPQYPINSGFSAASTTQDVITNVDLHGRTAIVTGGYSGLGLETTRTLAAAGAEVVVPARDCRKAEEALRGINGIKIKEMDLVDPTSIEYFANWFLALSRPLDILVNSAGIMALPTLTLDSRGFEYHFATNHLGHFQLTTRLLPALRASGGARVISVSARAHQVSDVVFDDPFFQHRKYQPMHGYGQSKTANILFAVGLDMREASNGIRAFSLHPGSIVSTDLGRNFTKEQLLAFGVIDAAGNPILDPQRQLKTVEQGAATQVWCATNQKLAGIGGVYCENVEVAQLVSAENGTSLVGNDLAREPGVMPYAVDPASADRLWSLSERFLGSSK